MKQLKIILILLVISLLAAGCNVPFAGNQAGPPMTVYNIMGVVLEKPNEDEVLIGTSVLSDTITVNPVLWQQLQPGDVVEVAITLEGVISINLPEGRYSRVSFYGPTHAVDGFVTAMVQENEENIITVASDRVSGTYNADITVWNALSYGDQVTIFYNLQGIQGIVPN